MDISLDQGHSLTTMFLVAVGAIALAGVFYWRAFGTLRPSQWQMLFALRAAEIIVIVLLLFRPVFSFQKDLSQKPAILFMLDRSASMNIADDASGLTRFNQGKQLVEDWDEKLANDFDLHVVAFSERGRPLAHVAQVAMLVPDGKATSLSSALKVAADVVPLRDVEAMILLSDGVHNSAGDPNASAVQISVPVHSIGIGASLKSDISYRDLQVTGMNCPDRLMLDNKARISASIEGVGLAGRVVTVFLEEEGEVIDESELTIDQVEGSQEVVFEIRPTVKGRRTFAVRIPPLDEEKIEENNERSSVAMVVEPGIRVLYIEGTLRAEYGALVDRFLAKDPDLEFCALVQTRPNQFLKRTNIEGLELTAIPQDAETINTFNVFIIGDLDATYWRGQSQQLIVERIRDGAGLIMLGGYHSLGPGGYEGTPIGDVLPLLLGKREVGQITDEFIPVLTPEGARHPMFANIVDFFPRQNAEAKREGLPPLSGCTRVLGARPGATILATCPLEEIASGDTPQAMPLLAIQPVGRGRAAVFCADTTRAWQQEMRAVDEESPFARFWGQTVRFLAGQAKNVETTAGIHASTDKAFYEPEEPIAIAAVVRDEQGEGAEGIVVQAKVINPAGQSDQVKLTAVPGPPGHYGGTYEPAESGPHRIVVNARIGELVIESAEIPVEVGRPNLEFEALDLDEKMLGDIATATGGRYLHISSASMLIDQLDRSMRQRREHTEKPLFSPPWFWLLFVGLVTTEWVLRRRFQLR